MEVSNDVIHPSRRLGRRPPKNAPALMLGDILTGVAPDHPVAADHFSAVGDWGLYTNDRFGVCGPTSAANSRKLTTKIITGAEQSPTLADVYDLYRRSGNPNFDPATGADDNGVDMQTMCEAMLSGGLGGVRPLAFAKVDHNNLGEMDAAVDIFGFLLLGVSLQVAQQQQTDSYLWDYSQSADWGGHAVLNGRYKEDPTAVAERRGTITWAMVVDMTDNFIDQQLDEAWVVIWPEFWNNPVFDRAVDKSRLADIYRQLTDRAFPVPTPPAPTPTPQPTPAPSGANFQLDQEVLTHLTRSAQAHSGGNQSAWLNNHLRRYFKLG